MKTAFVFSGQGAQYQGMGQELYNQEEIVQATFAEASQVLGYSVADLCFKENQPLNETKYTQPAILTVSVAFYRLLEAQGFTPDAVAGLSLGEYAALVAAEALDFKTAVALVAKRGAYMTEAAPAGVGKMVAVLNADALLIEECCQKARRLGIVAPANYNTASQIVIGGESAAVDEACDLLKAAGVKRLLPLNVSGPFHTALLKPAAERLSQALAEVEFSEMVRPLISNTTGKIMEHNAIKELLPLQVMSAVRWEESIQTLAAMGITQIVEIGPGKVLTGFIKKINKEIVTSRVEDRATLMETLALFSGGRA